LIAVLALALGLLCARVHAQAIYGSINGTVLDPSGAAVVGARVTVTDVNKGTQRVQTSNTTGAYYVQNLIPDPYTVQVEAAGFTIAKSTVLTVVADSTIVFDVRLIVGSSTQTVQVTTEAPQLTTDRAEVATNLDERTLVEMPNIDRNITALVMLAPGTSPGYFSNANAEDPQRSFMVSANGQAPEAAGFVLDGVNDKDGFIGEIVLNPPLDSIQESKFVSQDYDAEFGAAIAGITVMQTKSGSNKFHGSAFEYRHSDAQEARDPFTQYPGNTVLGTSTSGAPIYGPDIPPTMYNKFGGSIGGPIIKDKLFFFGDYQGTRSKVGNSFVTTVPTTVVQSTCGVSGVTNCDLSQYLAYNKALQAYKPLSGAPVNGVYTGAGNTMFPNNQIPNSSLNNPGSIAAIKFMNLVPKPTVAGVVNNFVASGDGIYNFNQYDVRIDDQIKDKLHVFGRWGYLGSNQSSPAAFGEAGGPGFGNGGWAGSENGNNQSLAAGADFPINSKLLTEFRFGWLHYAFIEAKFDGQSPLMNTLGWAGLNSLTDNAGGASAVYFDGDSVGLTSWGSSNGGGLHCNCPLNENENEYEIVNNWTRDAGRHSIKFGADLGLMTELRIPSDDNRTGEFSFYAQQASTTTPTAGNSAGGLALASYLFGDPGQMVRYYSTSTDAEELQNRLFFYVEDTWRATDKFTFSLGGRWEIFTPERVNGAGNGGFWNYQTDMIQAAGVGQVNLSANIKNNYSYLEPRLGVAYQLTPKTVLRAGLGRVADPGYWGAIFGQMLTQTIPVLQAQSFVQASGNQHDAARNPSNNSVYNIANAPDAPPTFAVPASGMFLLPEGQAPRTRTNKIILPDVYGWNATYQWQINSTFALSAAYVGSKSSHTVPGDGWAGFNVNDAPMYGYKEGLTCNADYFYLNFGQLYPGAGTSAANCGGYQAMMTGMSNAHYNAFETVLDKRYGQGLEFQASYVYSHATGVTSANQFIQNPHINWGNFGYNRPSYFKLYGNYDLPFGRGRQFGANTNPIVSNIIGGFTLNSSLGWGSGLPYNMSYAECSLDDPTGECKPNQTGSFSPNVGSFNATGHYQLGFQPISALATNGASSGVWVRPASFTQGNEPSNNIFSPKIFTTDATLRKTIVLHEEMKLAVEADARDVFNHVDLGSPNACIDCSNGGQITDIIGGSSSSLGGMRQLEFGAHLTF
jgi:hypothetical protein